MYEYLAKYKYVPSNVIDKLRKLKGKEMSDYTKIIPSALNSFFDWVWDRLNKLKKNYARLDAKIHLSNERSEIYQL